ncbi:hypothetical protein ATCM_09175 [Stenotrophomonas sp. ATCM1_4]|jgi:hypothetical protein|uniref:Uncharacterized protein n=1 Tax=Stenotrophomonas capsici TaxID=3110230 RepID=A0ABU5V8H2_9GAMM|nr:MULTISPECIES: hypothetical protein [unclassified Stenotrophomonas]MBD9537582.1 hypothetical protein [Stenotrophomonas sp. STM01]MEA5669272.1 hypothetical protein [Stenotrophomonas sp. MH1]TDB27818.1 hypothetical protein ATCM_09175 [Stenotrophomonas sp. ATCM1_4]
MQNLSSLRLTDKQLSALDAALTELEAQLVGLVAMSAAQRKKLSRMGSKSEAFCRQTLHVLAQNPQVVPATLSIAEALSDLDTLDRLRPRLQRILRLAERASDTDIALRSDVMRCALDGYALLKVAGRNQGLEALRRNLGSRFSKSSRGGRSSPS